MAYAKIMNQNAMVDGETIMVIGPSAKTRTGRRIALGAANVFIHPEKGQFSSFMGYMALSRRMSQGEPISHKGELEFRRAFGERAETMFSQCGGRRIVDEVDEWADLYLGHLLVLHETSILRGRALEDVGLDDVTSFPIDLVQHVRRTVKLIVDDSIDPDLYEYDPPPAWQTDALVKFYTRIVGPRDGVRHG